MEIKRGSTANESISLPRESATGPCGRKLQIRRRDVRTAAICKAMRKRALPWSGVVADVRLRSFGLEASMGTAKHAVAPYRFSTVRSRWSKSLTIPKGKPWPSLSCWLPRARERVAPHEFGVFVRSSAQLDRARAAVPLPACGLGYSTRMSKLSPGRSRSARCTWPQGLEFRAVVVMACDDEVIPFQERIETVTNDSDLEEVYKTERQVPSVASTRTRDFLLVSGVAPAWEADRACQTPPLLRANQRIDRSRTRITIRMTVERPRNR